MDELLDSFMKMRDYLIETTKKLIEVKLGGRTHRDGFPSFVNSMPIIVIRSGHFRECDEKLESEYIIKISAPYFRDLKRKG